MPTARRLLALLPVLAAFSASAAEPVRPPNIICIVADDLGWGDLSCQGETRYISPHIDALAASGVRCTNAYAAAAICSPARAALLTGRSPARIGITDWIRFREPFVAPAYAAGKQPEAWEGEPWEKMECPPNPLWMELGERTIAEVLGEHGYATAHIGKWHLGEGPYRPDHQGFQLNMGGCGFGDPPSYFDPYTNDIFPEGIPTLPPRREGEYLTERERDEALTFLRAHRDGPVFLDLWFHAVHMPWQAPADLVTAWRERLHNPEKKATPVYGAMIEVMDQAVGAVLDELETLGIADNTLVIFTSDNGGFGPAVNNLRGGKGECFEGGIRVPLIARWPGHLPTGSVIDTPCIGTDLAPTFAAVAGAAMPEAVDGQVIVPLLTGTSATRDLPLVWHYPHYRGDRSPWSAIRIGDYKLIRRYDPKNANDRVDLFDLAHDAQESKDLASEDPSRAAGLEATLDEVLTQQGAHLPRPNPRFDATSKRPR